MANAILKLIALLSGGAGSIAAIRVEGKGQNISNGDNSPSLADGTDFSTTSFENPLSQQFFIYSTGQLDVTITAINLPPEFGLSSTFLPYTINASDPDDFFDFTVDAHAETIGTFSGNVSITSSAASYTFAIKVIVTA